MVPINSLSKIFQDNIVDNYHQVGVDWLERLESLVVEFEARWSITVGEPFPLSFSFCAPAVHVDGRDVVLKLEVPTRECRHRIEALKEYNGHSVVQLLDSDPEKGATLMERLLPGKMLADHFMDDEESTRIAASVMDAIWIPGPREYPFPTIETWLQNFKKIYTFVEAGKCPLPEHIIRQTIGLADDLLATSGESVLLHGDLHHFNILSVDNGANPGWKAIDPFGVIGEREVEVGAFLRNPNIKLPLTTRLREILLRRIEIFYEELGLDRHRILAWSAVYAGFSAWWTISVGADGWQLDAELAKFFASNL